LKILAIETATEACSAALLIHDTVVEQYQLAPRRQSELILPMIDELMSDAGLSVSQLDAVAFGRGPGAFTGVRLAAAVTQGIAFAADLPVLPVSTLAAMAESTLYQHEAECAFTAIDARMKEIYWAVFNQQDGCLQEIQTEAVLAPEQVEFPEKVCGPGVGSGWSTYVDVLNAKLGQQVTGVQSEVYPRAASVARLGMHQLNRGGGVSPEQAIPVYLRNKVANRSGERS